MTIDMNWAGIVILVLTLFGFINNLVKWGESKSDQTYGGGDYVLAITIAMWLYYKAGLFTVSF